MATGICRIKNQTLKQGIAIMTGKLKEIITNLICILIPVKRWCRKIRSAFAPSSESTAKIVKRLDASPVDLTRRVYGLEERNEEIRLYNTEILTRARRLHTKTFLKFAAIHCHRDIVLVAAGPTLNYYSPIMKNAIHVGVNKTFKINDIDFDYLFLQDFWAVKEYLHSAIDYRKGSCIKFIGILSDIYKEVRIPDEYTDSTGVYRYYTGSPNTDFSKDISKNLMPEFFSVVFPAMSFSLYTCPKRIFLAGCDCGGKTHFDGHELPKWGIESFGTIINGWKRLKEFSSKFYPGTEIYSINPVNLRGIFHDVYTEKYLSENPDIDGQSLEAIINL